MAGSVNKVILIGHLGRDPEMRYSAGGSAVANVSVATNESWRDRESGERQERTEWHRVVFFGKLAEIAGEYLKKGSQLYVEGRLQTRKWQDKDGQDRYTTEIVASNMTMLGSRAGAGMPPDESDYGESAPAQSAPRPRPAASGGGGGGDFDDDIPF